MGRKSKEETPKLPRCKVCDGRGIRQSWNPTAGDFQTVRCADCKSEVPYVGPKPSLPSLEMMLADLPRIAPNMAHYILSLVERGVVRFPEAILLGLMDRAALAAKPDPAQMPTPAFLREPDKAEIPSSPPEESSDPDIPF